VTLLCYVCDTTVLCVGTTVLYVLALLCCVGTVLCWHCVVLELCYVLALVCFVLTLLSVGTTV